MTITIYSISPQGELKIFNSLDDLIDLREEERSLWVDLETEDPALLNRLAQIFNLHELTIEDCLTTTHYPKLDDYGQYLFMIFRSLHVHGDSAADQDEDHDGIIEEEEITRAVSIFLAKDFIITHRTREIPWLDAAGRQLQQLEEHLIPKGTDQIAYRVIDVLVDRFSRGLNHYEDFIETFERHVITESASFDIAQLHELKRGLTNLRHIMRDQKVVVSRLAQDTNLIRERQLRRYFKDIDDHAFAIISNLDKLIEALSGIRDMYLAMVNVRLGYIMRVLAVITTVAAPLNLVVGIYGMNFDVLPLSHDHYGFWLIMAAMSALTIFMLILFRRNRWI